MKITEATTLAELQAYLAMLGDPFVTVTRRSPRAEHKFQATVYLPRAGTFNGWGQTHAEALEDGLASMRSACGITNLAYEPLNYVRERPTDLPYASAPFAAALDGRYPIIPREKAAPVTAESEESENDQYDRATGDLGSPILTCPDSCAKGCVFNLCRKPSAL